MADEQVSAHEMLRNFEDKHLGADHPRHLDIVEKGSGSPFATDRDDGSWGSVHRAHHAAIEHLISAEAAHVTASKAMADADAKLEAALKAVQSTGEALENGE